MSVHSKAGALGQALVDFTINGRFPEEDVSSLKLSSEELPPAIHALAEAKSSLEVWLRHPPPSPILLSCCITVPKQERDPFQAEIHTINEQTAPDVSTWKANAKSLQDDILRSRHLANDILRQAAEPAVSGEATQEAAEKVAFLQTELAYNTRVREALAAIKEVSGVLDRAEAACRERRILDALGLLESAWGLLDALPVGRGVRAVKLLDLRAFELKNTVHEVFEHVWKALVHVDVEAKVVSISQQKEGEAMSLSDAVIGLKAYKEVDQRMAHMWHDVDQAVVGPRVDVGNAVLPAIVVDGDLLRAEGQADKSLDALFADMDKIFTYFAERLPPDLTVSMSALMMPEVISRIISVWLDSAVPASLKDMDQFERIMAAAKQFCARLTELKFSGFNELQEWVEDAPKVWLAKCRETALDTVRIRLSEGLGSSKQVERIEKQMVSRAEGQGLAAAPATAAAAEEDDWGAAWGDEGDQQDEVPREPEKDQPKVAEGFDEDGADAWAWGEEGEPQAAAGVQPEQSKQEAQDDDGGDAWGWGDEDVHEQPQTEPAPRSSAAAPAPAAQQREMTLKETYNISSMPEPVLQLIFAILEDGATLTHTEYVTADPSRFELG